MNNPGQGLFIFAAGSGSNESTYPPEVKFSHRCFLQVAIAFRVALWASIGSVKINSLKIPLIVVGRETGSVRMAQPLLAERIELRTAATDKVAQKDFT